MAEESSWPIPCNSCNTDQAQRIVAGLETFTSGVTGTMKALLAKDNSGTYTGVTQASCDTSDRLYRVFAPTNPVLLQMKHKGWKLCLALQIGVWQLFLMAQVECLDFLVVRLALPLSLFS